MASTGSPTHGSPTNGSATGASPTAGTPPCERSATASASGAGRSPRSNPATQESLDHVPSKIQSASYACGLRESGSSPTEIQRVDGLRNRFKREPSKLDFEDGITSGEGQNSFDDSATGYEYPLPPSKDRDERSPPPAHIELRSHRSLALISGSRRSPTDTDYSGETKGNSAREYKTSENPKDNGTERNFAFDLKVRNPVRLAIRKVVSALDSEKNKDLMISSEQEYRKSLSSASVTPSVEDAVSAIDAAGVYIRSREGSAESSESKRARGMEQPLSDDSSGDGSWHEEDKKFVTEDEDKENRKFLDESIAYSE